MVDEKLIQTVLSAATLLGLISYVVHTFYSGYKEHKKAVYDQLSKKQDKSACDEFRRLAERAEDREEGR